MSRRLTLAYSLLTAALAALGCADGGTFVGQGVDSGGASGGSGSGQLDADIDAGAVSDASSDVPPDPGCEAAGWESPTAFAPDTGGLTQIHGATAWHDGALWTVWNEPDEDGAFDVFLTAWSCEGTLRVPAVRLSVREGRNDIEPQIVGTDEGVLVVWQADAAGQSPNLSIVARRVDADGVPQGAAERDIVLALGGTPVVGNAWMPALAATAEGAWLAGAWAHPEATRFQAFALRLDASGAPVGEPITPALADERAQVFPAIVAADDGRAVMTWVDATDDGPQRIGVAAVAADGTVTSASLLTDGGSAAPAFVGPDAFVAVGTPAGAIELHALDDDGAVSRLDPGDGVTTGPALRAGPDGQLAAVWYRQIQGSQSEVWAWVGAPSAVDPSAARRLRADPPAAPYTPILVSIGPDRWFAGWSEGLSPAFTLVGQVLTR